MSEVTADLATQLPPPRRRWLRLAAGAVGYAAIALILWLTIDLAHLREGLGRLRVEHIPILVAITLVHIAGRALRFHALVLRVGPRDYRWIDGVRIFLIGFSLSMVTPARAGDLIKAQLVRRYGVSGRVGIGLVLVERLLDLIVICATIAISGTLLSGRSGADAWRGASLLFLACLVAGVAVLTARGLRTRLLQAVSWAVTRVTKATTKARLLALLEDLFASWDTVFGSPLRLCGYLLASTAIWFVEFLKLGAVLLLMGFDVEPVAILFVYPLSIIAGILTLIPVSEGVIGVTGVALLVSLTSLDAASATIAMVVDRAASILPPVMLCGLGLLLTRRGGAPRSEKTAESAGQ